MSWKQLEQYLQIAYRLTIFGYSAPKSDQAAIDMLKQAWGAVCLLYTSALYTDFYHQLHPELLSTRKNEEDTWQITWNWCKHYSGITGNCYNILLLFVDSIIYCIYDCRVAIRCYIQFSDFFSNGLSLIHISAIHGTAIGGIPTVDYFFDIFQYNRSWF